MSLKAIAICSPCGEKVYHDFREQVLHLQNLALKEGVTSYFFRTTGCSMLEMARSALAERGLASDADVLFWVDDDMTYSAEDALSLCRSAYEKRTMVGAMASQRKPRGKMNITLIGDPPHDIVAFQGGGLVEVTVVGFGMVAIHRSVFEAIAKNLPRVHDMDGSGMVTPFFKSVIIDDWWMGEDSTFCHHARDAGFQLFIDTRIRLGHRGAYDYHIEDCIAVTPRVDSLPIHIE